MLGLGSAIGKYRKGVVALGPECSKQGLRGLFLTQPTMWRDDLNKTEREIIWAGKVESPEAPKGYVSINDLVQAMARYNQTLLDACSSGGLECYDRATRVPKDESAMFDDCHFNENVAHIVAGLLAGHLSPIRYPFPWRRLSSPMLLPVAVVAGAARVVAFAAGPKHTRFGWASIQLRSR